MQIVHAKVSFYPGAKATTPQLFDVSATQGCIQLLSRHWIFQPLLGLLGTTLTAQVLNGHKKWEPSKKTTAKKGEVV